MPPPHALRSAARWRDTVVAGVERWLFRPLFGWAARRVIVGRSRREGDPTAGRFTRRDVDAVLASAWREYEDLRPTIPEEPGLGPKLNVRLAVATLAFHRALVRSGVDDEAAISLISDAAWKVFEKWGLVVRMLSRVLTRDAGKRMPVCVSLFLRFPFSQPAYRFTVETRDDDTIVIDLRRCPVASYFQAAGAGRVCAGTWCTQDFALAQLWGGRLELTGTLAGGADHCNFRFHSSRLPRGRSSAARGAINDVVALRGGRETECEQCDSRRSP